MSLILAKLTLLPLQSKNTSVLPITRDRCGTHARFELVCSFMPLVQLQATLREWGNNTAPRSQQLAITTNVAVVMVHCG